MKKKRGEVKEKKRSVKRAMEEVGRVKEGKDGPWQGVSREGRNVPDAGERERKERESLRGSWHWLTQGVATVVDPGVSFIHYRWLPLMESSCPHLSTVLFSVSSTFGRICRAWRRRVGTTTARTSNIYILPGNEKSFIESAWDSCSLLYSRFRPSNSHSFTLHRARDYHATNKVANIFSQTIKLLLRASKTVVCFFLYLNFSVLIDCLPSRHSCKACTSIAPLFFFAYIPRSVFSCCNYTPTRWTTRDSRKNMAHYQKLRQLAVTLLESSVSLFLPEIIETVDEAKQSKVVQLSGFFLSIYASWNFQPWPHKSSGLNLLVYVSTFILCHLEDIQFVLTPFRLT